MAWFDKAALRAYPGRRVAVVGEPGEAGPGSQGFQALLQASWRQIEIAPVPRWPNSQDRLVVYSRRRVVRTRSAADTATKLKGV